MVVSAELMRAIERPYAELVTLNAQAVGGEVLPIAGGIAVFCGDGNPMTQCLGCGVDEELEGADFQRILAFYRGRCSLFEFKLSPISKMAARQAILPYAKTISEFETILLREIAPGESHYVPKLDIRLVVDDFDAYARRAAYRFSGDNAPPGIVEVIAATARSGVVQGFEVYADDEPIAGCGLRISGEIAHLAGAAVLSEHRGRGLHQAMQAFRLAKAAEAGCRYAVQGALCGSVSQQNAQKNGFEIAMVTPTFMLAP